MWQISGYMSNKYTTNADEYKNEKTCTYCRLLNFAIYVVLFSHISNIVEKSMKFIMVVLSNPQYVRLKKREIFIFNLNKSPSAQRRSPVYKVPKF